MRPLEWAEIVAVGSELLTPSRIDTNSLTITSRLNAAGIRVRAKAVVGDRAADLAQVFAGALRRADLVVLTGGLGPTDDDVTREVVAKVLGRELHEDASIVERLRTRFARRGLPMPESNRRQALVPEGAVVLPNANGTAPGLWIEHGDQLVVLLPGPPRELVPMFDAHVQPRLEAMSGGVRLHSRIVRVFGRGESHVEEAIRPHLASWASASPPIEVTILAARGAVDLYLNVATASQAEAAAVLDRAVEEAAASLGDDVYSRSEQGIEELVGALLRERGWRIAAAESCTGGLLMGRLTDVPGSSAYVHSGVVCYSNEAKTALVGVDPALIAAHGAVSEPVATAMADGIRQRTGAEVGIGITGIAGPGGGSPEKPVGTVCYSVRTPDGAVTRTRWSTGGRELVRAIAVHTALDMLRRLMTGRPVP